MTEIKNDISFKTKLINITKEVNKNRIQLLHDYLQPLAKKGCLQVEITANMLSEIWKVPQEEIIDIEEEEDEVEIFQHWVYCIIKFVCELPLNSRNIITFYNQKNTDNSINYKEMVSKYYKENGIKQVQNIIEQNIAINGSFNVMMSWTTFSEILKIHKDQGRKTKKFFCSLVELPFSILSSDIINFSLIDFIDSQP